ncbi:MAG: hypothetical protein Q7K57_53340 [Burkholderiaceae bacterium]|nr:hypothetical protein [Burkholderiaceae bacterium]
MADTTSFTSNFYTWRKTYDLTNPSDQTKFGSTLITYQVQRFRDVANLDSELAYLVTMMQRIIIPNPTAYTPGPTSENAYTDYPAILQNEVSITANNNPEIVLRNIFPRTLNTQVSSSQSGSNGTDQSKSVANTSGSNQSTVNSYGVSVSHGFSGLSPMGSTTTQSGQSFTSGTMQSSSTGNTGSTSQNMGASNSMAIKDWSSYGITDQTGINPSWLFGQTYPWDVLMYNQSGDGGSINLPAFVVANLFDDYGSGIVLPPSQLSQFGIDFTMTANWLLLYTSPITAAETLQFTHKITRYTASHQASGATGAGTSPITATLQNLTAAANAVITPLPLGLSEYGLSPIARTSVASDSAIGFAVANWTIAPTSSRSACRVVSPGDTLQIDALGFDGSMTSDFSAPKTELTLTFKVADHNLRYTLSLMHWLGAGSGPVNVAWNVNAKGTGTVVVEAERGEGAQGNTSVIAMRNLDFSSTSFHDYLVVGTNTVTLTITAAGGTSAEYQLFAAGLGLA